MNKKKDFDGESKIVLNVPAIRCGWETETSKNHLKITPEVQAEKPQDYSLMYAEYGIGGFRRKFNLSNEIDQDKIVAEVKDGVLKLVLPKSEKVTQKISVKAAKE